VIFGVAAGVARDGDFIARLQGVTVDTFKRQLSAAAPLDGNRPDKTSTA